MSASNQILTRTQFTDFVARFEAPPGWDYETNGKPHNDHTGRIVGISMAAPIDGALVVGYIPVAHQQGTNADPLVFSDVAEYLTQATIVPYSLSTEYLWTATRMSVKPRIAGDGYVAARLLQLEDKGLKDLSASVLGREAVIKLRDLFPPNEVDFDFSTLHPQDPRVMQYVEDDGRNAFDLEAALRDRLRALQMHAIYDLEISAAVMMAEAELYGYHLHDAEFIRLMAKERTRVDQLEQQIFWTLGGKFSLGSPVQLGRALKTLGIHPRLTDKGNESWSMESLKLIPNPPLVVEQIIEWKSAWSVLNGLSRRPLKADNDGKVWPRWMALGDSGDPSIRSDKPELTQLPKQARSAFVAPPGTRWFMWAWLQPKIRALASLANDGAMRALFGTTYDFYTTVGATLRHAEPGTGTPEDRASAKRTLYAVVDYCGDVPRMAARLGVTLAVAQTRRDEMYALFPQMAAFLTDLHDRPVRTVTSYMGRRWVLSEETEWVPSAAISALLRHTVATWLKITLARINAHYELGHQRLKGYAQVLPVYDRAYYLLDETQPVTAHLRYMQSMVEPEIGGVKLRAEYGVGPSWGAIEVIDELAFAQQMADFTAAQPLP